MQEKKTNIFLKGLLWIIRIAVGGLFIFSGLVKANDPKGLAYKMGEFFEAWALKDNFLPDLMHWVNQFALEFAIIMIVLEIIAGIALIIGYRFKFFSWLIFLLTAFFTFLTAYVLFSGNIKACGCFGDCIPLTPKETFTKDIVLLILITLLLLFRNQIRSLFTARIGGIIMLIGLIIAIYINVSALKNLPFKDCLPFKIGNNIGKEMQPGPNYKEANYSSELIYKNLKTGKKKAFDMENIPWEDTLTWAYDTTLTTLISPEIDGPKILDFNIGDKDGNDVTDLLINYEQDIYLVFIKDVTTANTSKIQDLARLIKTAKSNNTAIVALSPSGTDLTDNFKKLHNLDLDFYTIDGVVCKTAMRTNPGVMLLNKGTILSKWSYNNIQKAITSSRKMKNAVPFNSNSTDPVIDSTMNESL